MHRLPVAVVPVKSHAGAKRRLAHVLGAAERAALAEALFEHVTSVLVRVGLRTVAVAAGEVRAPRGVEVWPEEAPGLNAALRRALARTGVPALVVPADLPRLRPEDVWLLVNEPGDVVVVVARDGGTNALLLRRPLGPLFGPGSALAHAQSARSAGLAARVVSIEGFEEDVDDETALVRAVRAGRVSEGAVRAGAPFGGSGPPSDVTSSSFRSQLA